MTIIAGIEQVSENIDFDNTNIMGVVRNGTSGHEMVMEEMFETKMGVNKKDRVMRTNYMREQIQQMWLQWGLENKMKLSQDNQKETENKVEDVRQKMAGLRTG